MTTTTLGAITPGEAKLFRDRGFTEVTSSTSKCPLIHWSGFDDSDRSLEEHWANAALYADAHNTAQKTGKLPSQLKQDVDELVGALRWLEAKIEYAFDEARLGNTLIGADRMIEARDMITVTLSKYNPKP